MSDNGGRRFDGASVVVTGAAQGMGRAVTSAMAQEGATVYRRRTSTRSGSGATAEELGEAVTAVVCDVRKSSDVDALFSTADRECGGVDHSGDVRRRADDRQVRRAQGGGLVVGDGREREGCLPVHAAGTRQHVVQAGTVDRQHRLPGRQARHCPPVSLLRVQGGGDSAEQDGRARGRTVGARQLHLSRGRDDPDARPRVRVDHGVDRGVAGGDRGAVARDRAAARFQTPEQIARAVLYLASDDASEITGQAINVDGGLVTEV